MRLKAGLLAVLTVLPGLAMAENYPFAIPFNEKTGFSRVAIDWARRVSEATEGRFTPEPALNSSLVAQTETLDALAHGVVPLGLSGVSFMSGTVPLFGYMEMLDGIPAIDPPGEQVIIELFPDLVEAMASHGVRPLMMTASFGTSVICRDQFLADADAWKGRTVRTAGRWQSRQIEAMGATPMPVAPSELYLALQNGTVDCAVYTADLYLASSIFEVAPYYTEIGVAGNATLTMVDLAVWDGLSAEDQQAILKVSEAVMREGNAMLRSEQAALLDTIAQRAKLMVLEGEAREGVLQRLHKPFAEAVTAAGNGASGAVVSRLHAVK